MKREIKFRAKELKNCKWRYGNLHIVERGSQCHIVDFGNIYPIEEKDTTIQYGGVLNWWEVEPETVGQFTGLLDKNGVEIYEGDIVRYETDYDLIRFEVKWNKDTLMWEAASQVIVDEPLYYKNGFIEVIGSIHDNLESFKIDNSET